MDQFFIELREIQKRERANSSLARIRSDFYKKTYKYLDKLKTNIENNPFSNEHYLLKDIQRIATEICERREHKIADAAVMNIQRSYHLFKTKAKFDLDDATPLNLTNEEEKLYLSFINTLKNHRESVSLDKLTEIENDSRLVKSKLKNESNNNSSDLYISKEKKHHPLIKNNNILKNEEKHGKDEKAIKTDKKPSNTRSNDKVLNRLNEIKKAKIIKEEKYEDINEQLNKSLKNSQSINFKSTDLKESTVEKKVKSSKNDFNKVNSEKTKKNLDLDNILNDADDEFIELKEENLDYDLDFNGSTSSSKDGKIVNETILIFEKVGAIVGVDEKIYGPFYPQDIVIMPNENANIIIKNKKGRLVKI